MKDIQAIISDYSEKLTQDEQAAIVKAVNANYKTIVEVEKKSNRIDELEKEIASLNEQISEMNDDSEEMAELKKQVEDFKAAEEKRKADEAENAKRSQFRDSFNAVIGDKEFANDLVRESVFDKVYEKCSNETGYGIDQAIKDFTENADGIWKNPQHESNKLPNPDGLTNSNENESSTDKAIRSLAQRLSRSNE